MTLLVVLALVLLSVWLLYRGQAYWAWVAPIGLGLLWWRFQGSLSVALFLLALIPLVALAVLFGSPSLRRKYVTRHVMRAMAPIFPPMSETERTALEAGTTWWDADLFSGAPKWNKLVDHKRPGLSERERAFLDEEVETICAMVDNEKVDQSGDLDEATWEYLKQKGFMGMIVPEHFGGLGFSAEANSAVVAKVSSHNVTLAVTVMVPNSLGPAELLLHYGTKEQREHWLPRLAKGEEVPAFALTESGAGSDASAMTSRGVVCKGEYQGREVTGIRLDWDKRYITLAPVATLLGLAFKLDDPDHLLGSEEHLGITCALIPVDTPGVEVGRRHDPLGIKFLNGPTTGKDVFVPVDSIIGGAKMAGQGWRMLMDCLSAGRSISLPALACGGSKLACRALSGYALVREQFGLPLARFEGVADPLGRMAGKTWMMDAARRMTAGAVATGQKPSVISAIVKAYLTEGMREVVNDAMDVQGGAGISRGPRNVLARMYQALPIGITVEGANILTRTLIIYGQGALRCHPFAFAEMEAARQNDLTAFDKGFFGHVGFLASNVCRAKVLGWTRGWLASAPVDGAAGVQMKRFTRLSAAFAVTSDVAMGTLGGALKRKELITGRLADALAWLYIGSSVIKRYLEEGRRAADEPFLDWSAKYAAHQAEEALIGVIRNHPNRWIALWLRLTILPTGRMCPPPTDDQTRRLARLLVEDEPTRQDLTAGIYVPKSGEVGLPLLDEAWQATQAAEAPRRKLRDSQRAGRLPRGENEEVVHLAIEEGVLSEKEAQTLCKAHELRQRVTQVDAYGPEDYLARCGA